MNKPDFAKIRKLREIRDYLKENHPDKFSGINYPGKVLRIDGNRFDGAEKYDTRMHWTIQVHQHDLSIGIDYFFPRGCVPILDFEKVQKDLNKFLKILKPLLVGNSVDFITS